MVFAIPSSVLAGTIPEHLERSGTDLLGRWNPVARWLDDRLLHSVDPYGKANLDKIGPNATVRLRDGTVATGINLASQDYLNLSADPQVLEAAKKAIDELGVHSAGSAALAGNSRDTDCLEDEVASFLGYAACTVFPTGWGAGYGTIRALIGPEDHAVIDVLAHACLQEGARAATRNVHQFPHLSNKAVERRLARIRASDPRAGILVITETLFSMDSDSPDLRGLLNICRQHDAILLVDVAHDLGSFGENGTGVLGEMSLLGEVDVVIGSFSKTFASNGGFACYQNAAFQHGLRLSTGPLTFTNALSPVQLAVIRTSLDIVRSQKGARLRRQLADNVSVLRREMAARNFSLFGRPSAIVPVLLGSQALSRLTTRRTIQQGAIVNLVEYPAVPRSSARWRLQVMAHHTAGQLAAFAEMAASSRAFASSGGHGAAIDDLVRSGD